MKLFDILPNDLFSVLASPNRVLYSDALDVLYSAYRETLKIPEEKLYTNCVTTAPPVDIPMFSALIPH